MVVTQGYTSSRNITWKVKRNPHDNEDDVENKVVIDALWPPAAGLSRYANIFSNRDMDAWVNIQLYM